MNVWNWAWASAYNLTDAAPKPLSKLLDFKTCPSDTYQSLISASVDASRTCEKCGEIFRWWRGGLSVVKNTSSPTDAESHIKDKAMKAKRVGKSEDDAANGKSNRVCPELVLGSSQRQLDALCV